MSFLLLAALAASPGDRLETRTPQQAAVRIAKNAQTGTLLFSRGDCLAVKVYTGSEITHVGAVVLRGGKPFVYESANGAGVRRVSLRRYLELQQPCDVRVIHPVKPFSAARELAFVKALDEQLDRPYGIKHFRSGERAAELHCAEYVTDALCACRLIRAKNPVRVSPGSLRSGVVKSALYSQASTHRIANPVRKAPANADWCARTWFDTKRCTSNCCSQLSRWFLCR
jgi:hypothetical protein